MFNLYQILLAGQGGQALDNLAERFGLSRDQADSAVKALIPALSTAFMTKAMHPGGMQEIAGAMTDDHHRQAYADPGTAAAPETEQKSGDIASSIFGNGAMVDTVVEQAARYTGLPESVLRQMLPVVVSMVLGGVATAMHGQGMGGMLGQLANSGLGNIFGQGAGAPAGQAAGGGIFGSILGSIFGGAAPGQAPQQQPGAGPTPGPQGTPDTSGLPPMMQAGMDIFGKMFQPGVQAPPGQGDLGDDISSILSGKK
ncbi:hypothetical protein RHAL1_00098 [Beijerinckiaceae bacterium RH AL1]|nr:DUF937 domain-containing protein [Beijerinckiaceae bacterium]VVB42259.1 hypothetical protein RHAL8_00097 [Beijerinckiaceae bacterium RH AL8]VVB42260.1 hypothetical protein RHCH11_RHCH11_00097 [Beijerinckiaceae bacterium RH CH11]VVC53218.1 hypothetical protein RHAL1_00098 [Beijerinckiaceae bacterium RH AL1]